MDYDPRYLAGIVLFNQRDFFEAHEVWEALWMDTSGPDKKFFQALIQAAVALHHFGNGNLRGATKLFRSSHDYMQKYELQHLGLDQAVFWTQMGRCFAEVHAEGNLDRKIQPQAELIPTIALSPPPDAWPDPAEYLEEE